MRSANPLIHPIVYSLGCSGRLLKMSVFTCLFLSAGVTVQEEVELIADLPVVEAHSSSFYTPPFLNMKFPEIVGSVASETKLHLAGACRENAAPEAAAAAALWSQPIDLDFEHSIFVCVPEVFDVRVSSTRVGHTLQVAVDPVNRAEVSAKEIRSRIRSRGTSQPTVVRTMVTSSVETKKAESLRSRSSLSPTSRQPSLKSSGQRPRTKDLQLFVCCLCRQVDIVVLDEQSCVMSAQEFMSVMFESVGIQFYPVLDVPHSTTDRIRHLQHAKLTVGNFQIDNLMYGKANYDFPVVVRAKTDLRVPSCDSEVHMAPGRNLRARLDQLTCSSLLNVHVELFNDDRGCIVQTVSVAVLPAVVCVEDVYISDLLRLIDSLIPRTKKPGQLATRRFPAKILAAAESLCCPVCVQRLCIDKMELMVSVHASMKLYIASDEAPLTLGRFEQTNLCTTSHQLMRVIAMHYAACALYRAGNWFFSVLGSSFLIHINLHTSCICSVQFGTFQGAFFTADRSHEYTIRSFL